MKFSVNLLPPEIKIDEVRKRKKVLITKLSIIMLVVMVILTSGVLAINLTKEAKLKAIKQKLEDTQVKINALKKQENLAVVLKSRLNTISSITDSETLPVQSYNLLTSLVPKQVNLLELKADKDGKISLSAQTNDLTALKELFDNLTDPKKNEGRFSNIKIESLSKGLLETIQLNASFNLTAKEKT